MCGGERFAGPVRSYRLIHGSVSGGELLTLTRDLARCSLRKALRETRMVRTTYLPGMRPISA